MSNGTMRAVMWNGDPYSMTVETVPIPTLQSTTDAIVRLEYAAICGTDLHTYHGVYGSPEVPWIMGHEGVGVVEEIGEGINFLNVGDYVVIPDFMATGHLTLGAGAAQSIGLGEAYGQQGGCQCEHPAGLVPLPGSVSAGRCAC